MGMKWSWKRTKALVVRLILFLHFLLVAWRVWVAWYGMLWLLPCAIVPFLVETAVTVFKRKGKEWEGNDEALFRLSFCFLFYSCATVPGIWLLEIKKTETYLTTNSTSLDGITIPGLNISLQLSSDTWTLVAEEMFLYLMPLGRWVLPRGDMDREDLSELLFAFLGMASDIMDLFSLFESDNIRVDMYMTYALLAVWSWSVLQFSLTFYNTYDDRIRDLKATFVSLLMQDGPFLALRMYAVVVYKIINHSMIFFVFKNIVVICLLLYKIFICCKCSRKKKEENNKEVKRGNNTKQNSEDAYAYDNPAASVSDEQQTKESSVDETNNIKQD